MRNILVVRNDRFGEFLLNIPAFRALKQAYPQAILTLVVNPYTEELAKCIDFADNVIKWDNRKHKFSEIFKFSQELKSKKFDACVILNPSREFNLISFLAGIPIRVGYNRKWGFLLTHKLADKKLLGQKHEIEYNLDLVGLIGANTADKTLALNIDVSLADSFGLEGDLIAIHPWTSDPIKQWPMENFSRLAKKITQELKQKVIIIGAKEESNKGLAWGEAINLTGKTSLIQLAAVLKRCRLLVSGDSGPVHLAGCVRTPVLAIFSNNIPGKSPRRWGPVSLGSIVMDKPNLSDISIEEVFAKIKEMLNK